MEAGDFSARTQHKRQARVLQPRDVKQSASRGDRPLIDQIIVGHGAVVERNGK